MVPFLTAGHIIYYVEWKVNFRAGIYHQVYKISSVLIINSPFPTLIMAFHTGQKYQILNIKFKCRISSSNVYHKFKSKISSSNLKIASSFEVQMCIILHFRKSQKFKGCN